MRYKWGHKLVLYHAVSSYQLLEVMLHRMQVHLEDRAILLLPDFIVEKYPQYKKLRTMGFFHRVYLLPYLHIPTGRRRRLSRQSPGTAAGSCLTPCRHFPGFMWPGPTFTFPCA